MDNLNMCTFDCEQNEKTKKWKYKILRSDIVNNAKIVNESDFIFDTKDISIEKAKETYIKIFRRL